LLGYPITKKFRDLQGSLTWEKFFMTVFEFIGQSFFKNCVYKLHDVFSELGIRVFFENGLGSFQIFLIL
jgi:transcription initiation factor IIF auxiliary subunit